MKKKEENLLDYIPVMNSKYQWEKNEDGFVVIIVRNEGFYNKIAQKLFKVPAKSKISLDLYGTFIWELIDGKNTIYDISEKVKLRFGKDAEPLYNRLVKYFQILKEQNFVLLETGK